MSSSAHVRTQSARFIYLAISLLAVFVLVACDRKRPSGHDSAGPDDVQSEIALRIMTFNIEWGGKNVSFDNVIEAIRRSDADIVGIQEAQGNLEELATTLGWNFDQRNYVVSRFSLLDPPGGEGKHVLVEVRPGEVVALANLHLPSYPYGPELVRDGATPDEVVANEHASRMPVLTGYLDHLGGLVEAGIPTFVTGDFNSPTHSDWTADLVGSRAFLDYVVEWPVSLALEQSGFADGWRTVYPDPVMHPGLTWWAGRPPLEAYAPGEDDPQDRIDMIWFSGSAVAREAQIVGEAGRPDVAISVTPWPSDHRAVVVAFDVRPTSAPALITTGRRVYRGRERVGVHYNFPGVPNASISVTGPGRDQVVSNWTAEGGRGRVETPPLAPGHYFAKAVAEGKEHIREFWVLARDAVPKVEVAKTVFAPDEPVQIRWQDAPGYRNDYIAVYAASASDNNEAMLAYVYVAARPSGQLDLKTAIASSGGSLLPGTYIARLMKDDGYEALAETGEFEVR